MESPLEQAARLPLQDAAFALWLYAEQLDREEGVKGARFALTIQETNTFSRLRKAHPNRSDEDLRLAIKTAIDFFSACSRYNPNTSAPVYADVDVAIGKARKEYPDFLDDTYSLAHSRLCMMWR